VKPARQPGFTLIELLVAMVIAGLVGTFVADWIVHAAKMSAASQRRDDREQDLALVRKALFEDGTRGSVLEISRESWTTSRSPVGGSPDTVRWTVESGSLLRQGAPVLVSDTVEESRVLPHFPNEDPGRDTWIQCDRDLDGKVDDDFVRSLTSLEWTLLVRHRGSRGGPPVEDTLRLVVPLHGPG
jgi:prepilin-type N-terminal cleavage/methylation domain-containing protein